MISGREKKLERTYVVIEKEELIIELIGNEIIYLNQNDIFVEPGYKAVDSVDGDITSKVVVSNNVDVSVAGTYYIEYSVSNRGNSKSIKRTVVVKGEEISLILNGDSEITIKYGSRYIEPGYKAIDSIDGDITNRVIVSGIVDNTVSGTYYVEYTVTNSRENSKTVKRKVVVLERVVGQILFTLNGEKKYMVEYGSKYSEPGYKAIDSVDGDITNKVVVNNGVNTNLAGTYYVTYKVTNSSGITKCVKREVIVLKDLVVDVDLVTKEYTNASVHLVISVSGDNFKNMLMPDGNLKTDKSIFYEVKDNGTYTFKVYTLSGREIVKKFEVKNIDRVGPNGSCVAYVKGSRTEFKVTATDSGSGIEKYMYKADNYTSSVVYANEHVYNGITKNASVSVLDKVGNTTNLNCNVVVDANAVAGGHAYALSNSGNIRAYWIYVPDDYASIKKPLVIFLHGDAEKGTNVTKFKNLPIYRDVQAGKKYDAIMLMPQMSSSHKWRDSDSVKQLKALIDSIVTKYNVDTTRISISGASAGGIGTYAMLCAYPSYFSAAASICGGWTTSCAPKITSIPIWAFHGTEDKAVSYTYGARIIGKINSLGGNAKLTTYQGAGHNITDRVFSEVDLVSWLISNRRS